ncbi:serine hydrolase domain-containing protein [Sphingomicrobium astaxanthinifaciens]|uniref:serine hydrolase domain-containing protein n=1 Tax=Sphingomicrobium astaxanthinifaciens TaxID=1227949 RepID=UPI001FCC5DF3|nr:serine hydrolase domain-containing protein [Sphingomicrobium astaxanthinifaciens]MCJ7421864.1 beta-lactamase family protein [Sphingomicrobium astaxanthinifaciens]
MKFSLPALLFVSVLAGGQALRAEEAAPEAPRDEVRVALPAPAALDPAGIDYVRLDRRLERLVEEPGMVGLAVGIVEDGRIAFVKGYGETLEDTDEPVGIDTVFRWASVSKGVAGTMAAKLAAERRLSLDLPISNYSRTLRLPEGNQFSATLRDVLSHRLGIWRNAYDDRLEAGQDPDAIRGQLGDLVQICPVGRCWSYQNVAFDSSAEAIERGAGKRFAEALEEELFGPLGMRDATVSREGLVGAPSWAHPHSRGKREVPVTDAYYRVPAAGGVNSDILDLAIWLKAQVGGYPEILAPEVLAEAHRPLIATPGEVRRLRDYRERLSDARYGLGWRIYDYAGHEVVGHRGGVNGYRSLILFDPARDTGIVALWNSNSSQPNGVQFELLDMLYGLEPRDWLELDG